MTRRHPPGEVMTVKQYRKEVARTLTEVDFQTDVIDRAQRQGWKVAHFRGVRIQREDGSVYYATPVQADGEGWLDLYMTRGPRAIVAELKVASKKPTAAQEGWMAAHHQTGVEVYLWYPKDSPEIDRVLAR